MQEIRCKKCNRLLCKTDIFKGTYESDCDVVAKYDHPLTYFTVEIKCPRCGGMNTKKESVENERK
jgi:phage FluMu protein Com